MQEKLQQLAPHLGCQCQNLWEFREERNPTNTLFRATVVLKNLEKNKEGICLGWSDYQRNKKASRSEASRLALDYINCNSLIFRRGFLVVADNCSGADSSESVFLTKCRDNTCRLLSLPDDDRLVHVEPIVLSATEKGPSETINDSETSVGVSNSFTSPLPLLTSIGEYEVDSNIPSNLGRLGEQYACRWLRNQIDMPDAVHWCNVDAEQQLHHDIECRTRNGLKYYFEVKTNWGKSRVRGSDAQVNAVLNNDRYVLLHIREFCNVFAAIPTPPQVRLFCNNPKGWNDIKLSIKNSYKKRYKSKVLVCQSTRSSQPINFGDALKQLCGLQSENGEEWW